VVLTNGLNTAVACEVAVAYSSRAWRRCLGLAAARHPASPVRAALVCQTSWDAGARTSFRSPRCRRGRAREQLNERPLFREAEEVRLARGTQQPRRSLCLGGGGCGPVAMLGATGCAIVKVKLDLSL